MTPIAAAVGAAWHNTRNDEAENVESIIVQYGGGYCYNDQAEELATQFLDSLGFGPAGPPENNVEHKSVNIEIYLRSIPAEMFKMHKAVKEIAYSVIAASSHGIGLYYVIIPGHETKKYSGDGVMFIPFSNISGMYELYGTKHEEEG